MRNLFKLTCIGLCAVSFSGCAFTQQVAQAAYDSKAEENCSFPSGGEQDSIHRAAKTSCVDGKYVPKDLSKYEKMPKYEPKKSE